MNSQENSKQKNSERIIDDFYNFCKRGNLKKIENILSSNSSFISKYTIDEAIRIVIRNFNSNNIEFQKCLNYLLKFNSDINFKNESQNNATVLMEAASSEKIKVLETLLNSFEIKNCDNRLASSINKNVNMNSHNQKAKKPGSLNASPNNNLVVDSKMQSKITNINKSKNISNSENSNPNDTNNVLDLNIKDSDGQTVLHKIINSNSLDENYKKESLKILIDKGADLNEENILGYTPLSLALLMGNFNLSEFLINSGANIHHVISTNNENMLHCAVRGKNPAVVSLLIGVDPKHKNKHGETSIDMAKSLNLLSFIDFFNRIDSENSDINLNNKIISSMLPINDILNKNYKNVLSHLYELKSCLKINNSEMRFIWNALLAEYYNYFENEQLFEESQHENTNVQQISKAGNVPLKNIIGSNSNNNSINPQQLENIDNNINNLNLVTPNFTSTGGSTINTKNTITNKANSKKNRKGSNLSTTNSINSSKINLNENSNILLNNTENSINWKKNRKIFIEKFIEFINNNDNSEAYSEHNKIFFYNSGLFWFKFSSFTKCFQYLFNCLKINSKKNDFLFFTNSSLVFINIFHNIQEFQIANRIIEVLETYISKSLNNTNIKLGSKNIITTSNIQNINSNDESKNLLNSPNKKSLVNLYNQREIINKNNNYEELTCILNILKSQNYLFEEKVEECKKYLKEYRRLWNILIIKESSPLLFTLKKIYHVIKIRIHYINNTINKSLKHLNFLEDISYFSNKNEQENLQMQICKLNSFGILNLKQKKYALAQFNFKNAIVIIKKFSSYLNFDTNIHLLAVHLTFNLALSYFFEKRFESCYKTLKKINGKLSNNPFYFYRLGLSTLEIELNAIKEISVKDSYNEILSKYNGNNKHFNFVQKNNSEIDSVNKNNNNKEPTSPENISNININEISDFEIKSESLENTRPTQAYNACYILKNNDYLFLESERITEAIQYFTSVITLIKNNSHFQYYKEISELWNFYNESESSLSSNKAALSATNKNSNKTFNYSLNANNQNTNTKNLELKEIENLEKIKPILKSNNSKSYTNVLISSYLNLLFCLSLKNRWSEMLFYINNLEASNLPIKDLNYIIDNYKMEAYMGLNQTYKVIELLKKNMSGGNYIYNCLDLKGYFFSKLFGTITPEINLKIALYCNVIKLNFLNNNILEVEKGIVKIIGLYNMNLNLNQNIENISLPTYLINILIYYYLIKENYDFAKYIIRKRKLPPGSFDFLVENTNRSL